MKSKIKFKKIITITCLILTIILNTTFVFAETKAPDLTAKAALLIDVKTGKILYSKNETERMYNASTTKILTAILTIENCNLNDIVTVEKDISATIPYGYTTVQLKIGEQFTIEQLLELLLIHSANDVANLLAEHIAGSVENFASMMNKKISELGLTNTHFTNPSGVHDENHYTTAKDLAAIMKYCIQNEYFKKISSMPSCNIPATNKFEARIYESTNRLIVPTDSNYYPYLICGKTGYTDAAGECLVSYANKDGLELICVILGSETIDNMPTRYSETKSLFEYGYSNFSIREILNKNDFVTQIKVKNGSINTRHLNLISNNTISTLLENSQAISDLKYTINLKDNIKAPITEGDILGNITYSIDGNDYKTDLIASHSVEKSNLVYYMIEILIGLILIFIVYLILAHRRKNKFDDSINIDDINSDEINNDDNSSSEEDIDENN